MGNSVKNIILRVLRVLTFSNTPQGFVMGLEGLSWNRTHGDEDLQCRLCQKTTKKHTYYK